MKRDDRLRDLSVDHHHALVLALRAKRAALGESENSVEELWATVRKTYDEDLRVHFEIEEATLLPALEAYGANELVERTLNEHQQIRGLAHSETQDADTLLRFAEALKDHVRFEEREVFEYAQDHLSAEALQQVAEATAEAEGREQ